MQLNNIVDNQTGFKNLVKKVQQHYENIYNLFV